MHSFISGHTESSNPAFFFNSQGGWDFADSSVYKLYAMQHFVHLECVKLFSPIYQTHSLFTYDEEDLIDQYNNYFILGFKNALLTPKEYLDKLTDYSEENKTLNYISAYFSSACHVNIIIKVGFGVGDLKRDTNQVASTAQLIGAPYQLQVNNIIQADFIDKCGYVFAISQ